MSPRTIRVAFAAATVVLAVLLTVLSPAVSDLPDGWITPVMALEFAQVWSDVAWLSDPEVAAAVFLIHRVDTFFPMAYVGVMALHVGRTPGLMGRVAAGIALAAVPADLYENHVIVGLTQAIQSGAAPDPWLASLPLATSVKWGLIGTVGAIVAVQRGPIWLRIPGGAAAIAIAAALVTFSPPICEGMALVVFAFFGGLIVASVLGQDGGTDDRDEAA